HTGHPQPGHERQAGVYLTQGRSTWTSPGPAGSCHCLAVGSETRPPAGIPDDILFVTQPALAGCAEPEVGRSASAAWMVCDQVDGAHPALRWWLSCILLRRPRPSFDG